MIYTNAARIGGPVAAIIVPARWGCAGRQRPAAGPAGRMPFVPRPHRGPFRDLPREVAILTAVSFTVALGFGIVAPDIPAFARHFGVSTAAAASVVSAFALMRIVGALPAGRLVDRFGEPLVMATGIAFVAVSSIVAGFSGSFAELIVLRGVGGLGSAMFGVSAQTLLLVSVPSEHRGRASGLFAAGFLLGGISGPALGGLVAAWSMRAPFIIYGGMLIVPAAIAAAVLRDGPRRRTAVNPRPTRAFAEIARALRSRAYRAAAAANLADGFAAIGVRSAIVPLFVRDVLHRSAIWTGIGFLVVAALNAATLLPGGWLADRLGRRPIVVAGCLVSAGGMVLLAFVPGLAGYLAALAVFGLGSGLLDVGPSAMIGDILGGQGGTVVASYQMAGDIGAVTGPVTAGYLVDTASYGAAFGLAAGVLGLAAIFGLFAPETRWRDRPVAPMLAAGRLS
jgi:DHA1 family multidrug resistance protein-like MFS transporter